MNEFLKYLETWMESKTRIFRCEGYQVSISGILGDAKRARYIDLDTDKLVARATLWESGELELEAIDMESENRVIGKSCVVNTDLQLDDELNWWLSEIATY